MQVKEEKPKASSLDADEEVEYLLSVEKQAPIARFWSVGFAEHGSETKMLHALLAHHAKKHVTILDAVMLRRSTTKDTSVRCRTLRTYRNDYVKVGALSGAVGGTVTGLVLFPLLPVILPSAIVAGIGIGAMKQYRANKKAGAGTLSQIGVDQMSKGGAALLVWLKVNDVNQFPVDISAYAESFGGTLMNVGDDMQSIDDDMLAKLTAESPLTDELVGDVMHDVGGSKQLSSPRKLNAPLNAPPKPPVDIEFDDVAGAGRRRCPKCYGDVPLERYDVHFADCDEKLRILASTRLERHTRNYGVTLTNFRDIGGWPVLKFDPSTRQWRRGRVRVKTIFRSSSIDRANQADSDAIVHELGIRSLMDLRTAEFCGQRGECLRRFFTVAHRVGKKVASTRIGEEARRASSQSFEAFGEGESDHLKRAEPSLGRRMLRRFHLAPDEADDDAKPRKHDKEPASSSAVADKTVDNTQPQSPPKALAKTAAGAAIVSHAELEIPAHVSTSLPPSSSSKRATAVAGDLSYGSAESSDASDSTAPSGQAFAQTFFNSESDARLWELEEKESYERVDWGRCYRLGLVGRAFESYIVSEAPKSNVAQAAWLFMTNKGAGAYRERVVGPTLNNDRGLDVLYQMFVELCQEEVNKFLQVLVKVARWPVAYYCNHGKDRTGWITALILSMCGVDRDLIIQNYALSDYMLSDIAHHVNSEMAEGGLIPSIMARTPPSAMRRMLAYVDARFGSVSNYLSFIGFGIPLQRIVAARLIIWDPIDGDNDDDNDQASVAASSMQ
jgi:uncharacterized membrane protein